MPQAQSAVKPQGSAFIASYVPHPIDAAFSIQEQTETIVLFLRKHPITNIGWIIFSIFLILSPTFLFPFLTSINFIPFNFPAAYSFIFTLFWYLGTFAFILMKFIFWYYNVNIVTNERVLDINFIYLLYSETSATTIEKIEEVTARVGGLFRSIFDYGDVLVQTAGEYENIEFKAIPHPNQVVETINHLMEESKL